MTVDVPPSILMIKKTKQHKAEIVLRMANTFKHQWLFSNLAAQMGCLRWRISNDYACAITCAQATATTMANGYNTVTFFHDISKIGKRTLATVHFKFTSGVT